MGCCCSPSSSSAPEITTTCCPDNPTPLKLQATVTFTGTCLAALDGTYEIDYNASANEWLSNQIQLCSFDSSDTTFYCLLQLSLACIGTPPAWVFSIGIILSSSPTGAGGVGCGGGSVTATSVDCGSSTFGFPNSGSLTVGYPISGVDNCGCCSSNPTQDVSFTATVTT